MARPTDIPGLRGRVTEGAVLAPFTWFRVGGPAELLFQPADADDLALFLQAIDPEMPVYDRAGRPIPVAHGGQPLHEILEDPTA